jgi:hypothetical protein
MPLFQEFWKKYYIYLNYPANNETIGFFVLTMDVWHEGPSSESCFFIYEMRTLFFKEC